MTLRMGPAAQRGQGSGSLPAYYGSKHAVGRDTRGDLRGMKRVGIYLSTLSVSDGSYTLYGESRSRRDDRRGETESGRRRCGRRANDTVVMTAVSRLPPGDLRERVVLKSTILYLDLYPPDLVLKSTILYLEPHP